MLATVARLKQVLIIDESDTSLDGELEPVLLAASSAIEDYCCRSFEKKEYTERISGGSKFLAVRNYPISGDPVITAVGGTGITDFIVRDTGILFRSCGWPRGEYNLTVKYIGGYVLPGVSGDQKLPASIEQACLILARMMYTG